MSYALLAVLMVAEVPLLCVVVHFWSRRHWRNRWRNH